MSLPIRVRLTLWYAALFAVTVAALSAFLVYQLRKDLIDSLEREARMTSRELEHAIEEDDFQVDGEDADESDFEDEAADILEPSGAAAQLLDADGGVLERYGAVAMGPALVTEALERSAESDSAVTVVGPRGESQQDHLIQITPVETSDGQRRYLVVAESMRPVDRAVDRVVLLIGFGGPAALLLTSAAAYWLARKAMQPVERITSDAENIGIDRLDERVAVPDVSDETRRLAITLNAMLDRIEAGMEDKRRLVADASHELRTPLAVMRTELDVSLRRDELGAAAREVLRSVREEVDRMAHTVDNLLTLALADEGRLELLTVPVDLRELAADTVRSLAAMAEGRAVRLVVTGESIECQADPQQIRLALTNLLENAIDFSPPGGEVRVTCWQRSDEVGVTVSDEGPGIAPQYREHVFDRFFRVDHARGRDIGGSGLGLAICRELAQAHGGRVWVESEPGFGSSFSLALPVWRTSLPAPSVPATTP